MMTSGVQKDLTVVLRISLTVCAVLLGSGCTQSISPSIDEYKPGPSWTISHGGITRGDPSYKKIALIFTGGEHGEGSEHILDVLGGMGIKASFFVTGGYIAKPEYHQHLRRMAAEGHYVGPHSDSHPLYCSWDDRSQTLVSEEFFKQDLLANINDLKRFGGCNTDGPLFFIPPYEWYNEDQVAWSQDLGLVLFNFTPGSGSNGDWIPEDHPKFTPSVAIRERILRFERQNDKGLNGFLMLLHLGSTRQDKMHLQLRPLLEELAARGYEFVRVDEMLRSLPSCG